MGMDLIGIAPRSEAGRYLAFTNSQWAALVELMHLVAPREVMARIEWMYNSGDGLEDAGAGGVAAALAAAIEDGRVEDYIRQLPLEPVATFPPVFDGTFRHGSARAITLAEVHEVAAFLRDSGGFEIR